MLPTGLINTQRLRIEDRLTDLNNKPIDVSVHLITKFNHPERYTETLHYILIFLHEHKNHSFISIISRFLFQLVFKSLIRMLRDIFLCSDAAVFHSHLFDFVIGHYFDGNIV